MKGNNIFLRITTGLIALLLIAFIGMGIFNIASDSDRSGNNDTYQLTNNSTVQNSADATDGTGISTTVINRGLMVYSTGITNTVTVSNTYDGYQISLPTGLTTDSTMAPKITKYYDEHVTVVGSVESVSASGAGSEDNYFYTTMTKYMGLGSYQQSNGVTFQYVGASTKLVSSGWISYFDKVRKCRVYRAEIQNVPTSSKYSYSYVFISNKINRYELSNTVTTYYRFLIKHDNTYTSSDLENLILNSFNTINATTTATYNTDYASPVVPDYWNDETKAYYSNLRNSDTVKWGLFVQNPENAGINNEIPKYEQYGNTNFDLVSQYLHTERLSLNNSFADEVAEQGKVLMLTLRWSWTGDNRGENYSVSFDLLRGYFDQDIKTLANQIKAAGHPIIIRMENEFNSDWTTACGLYTMCDPEIYCSLWTKVYNIFRSEGVDNAIFMSNPQSDHDYPNQKWNYYANYLPSKYYMQIAGVTMYNQGSTVPNTNLTFAQLYDTVSSNTNVLFSNWPWIIGEFGCSNEGVDKTAWIQGMFSNIHNYPQIKGAVWFNTTDNNATSVIRDYRLYIPSTAAAAFMTGVRNMKNSSQTPLWFPWNYE